MNIDKAIEFKHNKQYLIGKTLHKDFDIDAEIEGLFIAPKNPRIFDVFMNFVSKDYSYNDILEDKPVDKFITHCISTKNLDFDVYAKLKSENNFKLYFLFDSVKNILHKVESNKSVSIA